MISILLASLHIPAGRLQMGIGVSGDYHVTVGRWNYEAINTIEGGFFGYSISVFIVIKEAILALSARNASVEVVNVDKVRQRIALVGLVACVSV